VIHGGRVVQDALATKARVARPEPSPTSSRALYVVTALDDDDDAGGSSSREFVRIPRNAARADNMTKTTEKSAELLAVIRQDHAILIDEWPVRYRPASGTGSVVPGDPADDDLARYSIARAEEFIEGHEGVADDVARAQVVILKRLLYEVRFGDPRAYIPTQALQETLESVGESRDVQWLRSTVIAQLRDAGVLISSSPQGYKFPSPSRMSAIS